MTLAINRPNIRSRAKHREDSYDDYIDLRRRDIQTYSGQNVQSFASQVLSGALILAGDYLVNKAGQQVYKLGKNVLNAVEKRITDSLNQLPPVRSDIPVTIATQTNPDSTQSVLRRPHLTLIPTVVPTSKVASNQIVVASPVKLSGTYKMSRQGKNALTNVKRGSKPIATLRMAPTSVSKRISLKNKPAFRTGAKGVVITHRELISQLFSDPTTLNYSVTSGVINPGKSGVFPWLSTMAGNFDQYRFIDLKFHLVSNQPTTTGGRIGLGFDYDSTDPVPADRNEFFSLTYHTECAPWDSISLSVPVDNKLRFVNSHTITDSKLIDIGQIVFMSDTITSTSTALADVIVEYTVELVDAQQAVFSTMMVSGANPASFSALTIVGPSIGAMVSTSSTTVLEFKIPQGYYFLSTYLADVGAGSPTLSVNIHGATGRFTQLSITSEVTGVYQFKATTNDASVRFTFGVVTIANLEEITFVMTRISAAVYVGGASSNFGAAITTY